MKKIFKKVILIFLTLSIVLSAEINADMSIDAMEESQEFYEKHEMLMITTNYINDILQISFSVFFIVIPIIMLYVIIKQKDDKNARNEYLAKLGWAEFFVCIYLCFTGTTMLFRYGSESSLKINILNILFSILDIKMIINKFLPRDKNESFED